MASIGMAVCELGVEGSKVVAEMISVMDSLTSVRALRNVARVVGSGRVSSHRPCLCSCR